MTSLAETDRALEDHYRNLASRRSDAPVYGIEHGLKEAEIRQLALELSDRVAHRGIERADGVFIHIALASETGYTYEGMMSGYWPHMETLLSTPLPARDREALSAIFLEAHERIGLARPDDTPFSRRFRHIAWPLVNALAPRQIHAGLARALLEAALLDPGDTAFVGLVRSACLRNGEQRLIEWSQNTERVDTVATALLGTPDERLSTDIVCRLSGDAINAPVVRERLVRARRVRVSGKLGSAPPAPIRENPEEEELFIGFRRIGGLVLGFRRFASGVPLGICSDTVGVSAILIEENRSHEPRHIEPGQCAVFDPDGPAQLMLEYTDAAGVRRKVQFQFDETLPEPPVISVSMQPENARPTDIRDRQFSLVFAGNPKHGLRDVRMTFILATPGRPPVSVTGRLPRVPYRLKAGDELFDRLADAFAGMEADGHRLTSVRLDVDCGVCLQSLRMVEPDPEVQWFEDETGWHAVVPSEDEDSVEEALRILATPVETPLAVPKACEQDGRALLLCAEGFPATTAIVTAPTKRHGLGTGASASPLAHRRFGQSGDNPGLNAELKAWLNWNCARPKHAVAAIEARSAVKAVERALVTTLCGADWLTEEEASRHGGFADLLATRAIFADAVGVGELRETGIVVSEADIVALSSALTETFAVHCPVELAEPETAHLSDSTAEALDEAVNRAWLAVFRKHAPELQEDDAPDIYNEPGHWRDVWSEALGGLERRSLTALILPHRLAEELREISYTVAEPVTIARVLAEYRQDRGLLARRGRSMSSDDILAALLLWVYPPAVAPLDLVPLAKRLLEDRMTARAVRYAALRLLDAIGSGL